MDEGLLSMSPVSFCLVAVSENVLISCTTWLIWSDIAYIYAFQHSLTTGMQNHLFDGRGFAEHQSSPFWSISEKSSYLLNLMGYFDQSLHIYLFTYCPNTDMQNGH